MIVLIGFAFLAGIVTILSPCILPLLPIILTGAAGEGKARPWGIVTGFILSFTFFTLSLSTIVTLFQIPADVLRWVAGVFIFLFGLIMVVPPLKDFFLGWAGKLVPQQKPGTPGKPVQGFGPGFSLGITLGLVWTPCAGPIMASVITLAATQSVTWESILITLAYSLGTAVPMTLILLGGKTLMTKLTVLKKNSAKIQQGFGVLMILTSVALFAGWDRNIQTTLLNAFPSYGSGLTAIEENEAVKKELNQLKEQEP